MRLLPLIRFGGGPNAVTPILASWAACGCAHGPLSCPFPSFFLLWVMGSLITSPGMHAFVFLLAHLPFPSRSIYDISWVSLL